MPYLTSMQALYKCGFDFGPPLHWHLSPRQIYRTCTFGNVSFYSVSTKYFNIDTRADTPGRYSPAILHTKDTSHGSSPAALGDRTQSTIEAKSRRNRKGGSAARHRFVDENAPSFRASVLNDPEAHRNPRNMSPLPTSPPRSAPSRKECMANDQMTNASNM